MDLTNSFSTKTSKQYTIYVFAGHVNNTMLLIHMVTITTIEDKTFQKITI